MATYSSDNVRRVKVVSILHMVIASLLMITGLVQLTVFHLAYVSHIAFGIWGGIWIFVTGFLGYMSASNDNKNCSVCYVSTFMAFVIVTAIMTGSMLIFYGLVVAFLDKTWEVTIFLTVLIGLEFVLSILSSILCCTALCCGRPRNVQLQPVAVGGHTGQVMYIQQGQVPVAAPAPYPPATMQAAPQVSPAQAVQAATVQPGWQETPPPLPPYSGPAATGVNIDKT